VRILLAKGRFLFAFHYSNSSEKVYAAEKDFFGLLLTSKSFLKAARRINTQKIALLKGCL
jgi:hypothetical protein